LLNNLAVGVRRAIIGLGKIILVANTVVVAADRIFAMRPAEISAAHAWLGVVCYAIYIYFYLSGYSDIAIGLARMFGFRVPENFLWPYISDSMQEFWRHWFAWRSALSIPINDYVFVAVFGAAASFGAWRAQESALWTIAAWALLHGMFLFLERRGLSDLMRYLRPSVRHAYVLLIVGVGWVLLRSPTLTYAGAFLRAMVGLNDAVPTSLTIQWYLTPDLELALAAGVIGAIPIVPILGLWRAAMKSRALALGTDLASAIALAFVFLASIASIAPLRPANPVNPVNLVSRLARWNAHVRYFRLGVSPSPAVILGKDSWLFYADGNGLEDFGNDNPLSEDELAGWRTFVMGMRDELERQGAAYVITLAPDKYRIYPEEFPDSVRQVGYQSRLDQVYNALSDTRVAVDLRPALSAARASERIYDVTGQRWNDRGAFAAYQAIIGAVRAQNPSVPPPLTLDDYEPEARNISGRDLAAMMGLDDVLREDELSLTPKRPRRARTVESPTRDRGAAGTLVTEIPGSALPRAVVFRDGFGDALVPFLSEHFSRVVYVSQNDLDARLISREHANVVIQEIAGRGLYDYTPRPQTAPR
jgi:hypothetical protein